MGTQCIQCGIGSRPKFQDINLERLTGLKRLYVGPISRLPVKTRQNHASMLSEIPYAHGIRL